MESWEYKWVFVNSSSGKNKMDLSTDDGIKNLRDHLEMLGNRGWELVTVVPFDDIGISIGAYGGGGGGGTNQTMWVFKRPKKSQEAE